MTLLFFPVPMGEAEPGIVVAVLMTGLHDQTFFFGVEELRLNWRSNEGLEKGYKAAWDHFLNRERINVGNVVITCPSQAHLWMGCSSEPPVGLSQNTAAWASLLEGLFQWVSLHRWHLMRFIYYHAYWHSWVWNPVASNECCFHICCPFFLSWVAPTAYGGSHARGLIGAVATGLH